MTSTLTSSIRIPSLPESSSYSSTGAQGKPSFVCKTCGKSFLRSYGLDRHVLTHDENRAALEIKCPFEGCEFSALQKSNVKNHYASVHEKKKHVCTQPRVTLGSPYDACGQPAQCGQLFSDQSALIRHEKNAHNYYRRQAKEAGLQPSGSGPSYSSSVKASNGNSIARPRTAVGTRVGSVDLKFMPPLTYDPNAAMAPGTPLPSEKKVQSWLRSVDGRTAAARSGGGPQIGGVRMMYVDEVSSSTPHPGYASASAAAYATTTHLPSNGYPHPQQQQQNQAYYDPHSVIGAHHHSRHHSQSQRLSLSQSFSQYSPPQSFSQYSPTQSPIHPASHPSPQSQSYSDSDSASLQTASSHSFSASAYPPIPMAPGMYYHQPQPGEHKVGIESLDCYDYLYPREDLRAAARLQGGLVQSIDML